MLFSKFTHAAYGLVGPLLASSRPTAAPMTRLSHSLPRSRSVEQAPVDADGFKRSVDAPADPYEMRYRDAEGMTPAEVEAESKAAVSRGGARSSEALSGGADKLHNDPSWTMNEHTQHHAFGDWANAVVGDGVKETVKGGPQKVKESLKKMFEPTGGSGASAAVGIPERIHGTPDATPPGAIH